MRKVAVTGASGHVGNVLCRALLDRSYAVNALIHRSSESLKDLFIHPINGQLNRPADLDKLLEGADTVFHVAAKISLQKRDEKEIFKVNLEGTHHLLESCKRQQVKTLVYFSSIHVLDPFPTDELLDEGRNYNTTSKLAYERSKLEAEKLVLAADHLRTIVLYPTGIIGPYDFGPSLSGQAFMKIYQGKLPMILPYGFNWVDVRDIANASITAAESAQHQSRYILAGEWRKLSDMVRWINLMSGRKKIPMNCPPALAHLAIPAVDWCLQRLGMVSLYNKASLEIIRDAPLKISYAKTAQELNYSPRAFQQSVEDSIRWFQKVGKIK